MENESLKALLIEKIQSCENIELLTYISSLFENEFENDLIELSDSQKAEIDDRLANLENGEEELFDWEDVFKEIEKDLEI